MTYHGRVGHIREPENQIPIENERKYVLDPKDQNAYFNSLLQQPKAEWIAMRQGYLDGNSRIRQSHNRMTDVVRNAFTYKTKVNKEQIEIETDISSDDFNSLWTKVGKIIVKHRVVVPTVHGTWEVDFFRASNQKNFYLVMAEVELLRSQEKPILLPQFISANLLLEVEKHDKRFASKNLGRPASVATLLENIRNGQLQPT